MRTKTIATLGPSSMQPATLQQLVAQGVSIFRLNFSHGQASSFIPVVKDIRRLERETAKPLCIMGDLCGPKLRIGELPGSPVEIQPGQQVLLGTSDSRGHFPGEGTYLSLDLPEVLNALERGAPVYLCDGMLRLEVSRVLEPGLVFELQAQNRGLVTSNKGITFPGLRHGLSALTSKDRQDLRQALEIGLDAIALSFVQGPEDILAAKGIIAEHQALISVVAKLERQEAIDNLDSILEAADALMVARGDLGLECPLASLPILQKRIIRDCHQAQKAVIVATQMLLSMVSNPTPTRAETTDVANAVLDGADALMLSEETAIGEYPVEAIGWIKEIVEATETYYFEQFQGTVRSSTMLDPAEYLAYAAALIADDMGAKAIVSHSLSGATGRFLSSRRPRLPIYVLTPERQVMRTLNLFWGLRPRLADKGIKDHLARVQRFISDNAEFAPGDLFVLTSGQPSPGQTRVHTNEIKVYYKR